MATPGSVAAIVLAAGLSSRMGQPKPLMRLGGRLVIEHILATLRACSVDEVLVITGHAREAVEPVVRDWGARPVFNPAYAAGEMLSSIQVGIRSASAGATGALIVLGDQPSMEPWVVESVIAAFHRGLGTIVAPSYEMRRGHPVLVGRPHWPEILGLGEAETLRDFFRRAAPAIHYVVVNTASVLRDMDTPADYERELASYASRYRP